MSNLENESEGVLFPEKEGSVTLKYPMLTKSNYAAWAIKMEVFMMAQGVWDAVAHLRSITRSVQDEQIWSRPTVKKLWSS